MDAASAKKLSVAAVFGLLIVAVAMIGVADGQKHKRLRLTCDQTTDAIFQTAEQFRAQYNAQGFTIEDAPYGLLVGSGCRNVGKLTRQGSAYMADVHYADDGSPPFPGETDSNVFKYRWQWTEVVTRTKKGKVRTTVSNFACFKVRRGPPPYYDSEEIPC
jgi:hypothetical protein